MGQTTLWQCKKSNKEDKGAFVEGRRRICQEWELSGGGEVEGKVIYALQ